MSNLLSLKKEAKQTANSDKIEIYQNFFKTKPGEYGEGDIFIGLTVPQSRKIAKKYSTLKEEEIKELLQSPIHEERLIAVLMMVHNFQKTGSKEIIDFYLSNTKQINNWDLVDLSADKLLGVYLINKDKSILYQLVKSENLWEKRIAIISTFHFVKNNSFEDTLKLSEILLHDKHDLIHKAVGWMLREVGKRSLETEKDFLKNNYKTMPRTMLRYAIEKFPENERQNYLKGKI